MVKPLHLPKKLTILETASQVQWFVKQAEEDIPLAITPNAAYACQKLGQPYQKLEEHLDISKRLAEYGSNLYDYLEWEAWLDNWGQSAIPQFGQADFKPASAVTTELQTFFAEIWSTSVNLCELIENIQPTQIALWSPKIVNLPFYLHPSVSSIPAIFPSISRRCGIDVIDLSLQRPDLAAISKSIHAPTTFNLRSWLKQQLLRFPAILDLVNTPNLNTLLLILSFKPNAPRILFSGYGYDLIPVSLELRRQGARITILPDTLSSSNHAGQKLSREFQTLLTTTGQQLLQEPRLWAPLESWGIEPIPLWAEVLKFWWLEKVPQLWLHHQKVQHLLDKRQFAALVTWDNSGNNLSGVVMNSASANKLPRYIYQHGSSSGVDARFWQGYLRHTETLLVYGQGTVVELEQSPATSLKPNTQLIPVGSGRLDLLSQRYSPHKARSLRAKLQLGDSRPLIMYIPTCFATYGRTVNSDLVAYPDLSYFELMQDVLKLWNKAPGVRLIYKDFIIPNDPNRVMPDFIQTHIPDAIVTNHRLTDLMWSVDAIVIDHVITAISEVLLTNKPVVAYMPQPNTSSPQAIKLLRKRATVAETPEEFITEVRLLLQKGEYSELENPNTEFLQEYCTHLHDGQSAKRAASVILQNHQ